MRVFHHDFQTRENRWKCLEIVTTHYARVFEMTSPKKQCNYAILQFSHFSLNVLHVWFVVFNWHSLYLWVFAFNYPIVLLCTKFVFQKRCELEVIYILSVSPTAEGRLRLPKTIEEEELCVEKAVPKSGQQAFLKIGNECDVSCFQHSKLV